MMTPQDRLADACEKLHLLQTGSLRVEVEVDGRRVRYNRTDLDALEGYIAVLRDEVCGRTPRRGAIGFIF